MMQVLSINRVAQYTSHYNIDVSGPSQALVGEDVIITPGASGVWDDRVRIRQTVDSDDVSTELLLSPRQQQSMIW